MSRKEWKKDALHLWLTTDLTKSEIARKVGKARTTVRDYLNKRASQEDYVEPVTRTSKILVFDLETSPLVAYVWGLFKQNIPIDRIIQDWYLICWSAKWLGSSETLSSSLYYEGNVIGRDAEKYAVQEMWELLDEAEIVVAHNAARFDVPKINAKFLEYGLPEPSPYKVVDTLSIAKSRFKFTSNKLDYIAHFLGQEGKKGTGFSLWARCMENDPTAIQEMIDYCVQDVDELEKVYLALRGWDKRHPSIAVHTDDETICCGTCGSENLEPLEQKRAVTSVSAFQVYRCNNCGKVQKDGTNLLSTAKRKSLMRNIA